VMPEHKQDRDAAQDVELDKTAKLR
jgi:hypothetical protein